MNQFFNSLFVRQEFIERLLAHSFNSLQGWTEVAICAVLMWLSFIISKVILSKSNNHQNNDHPRFIIHLMHRLLWPILLLISAFITMVIWFAVTGKPAVWLQLLMLAASWMFIIRIALALLRNAIPNNRFTTKMEYSLSTVLWICFLLWLTGADAFVINLLKSLTFPIGSSSISLYTVIMGTIMVGIAILCALWISKFIEGRILNATRLDVNLRYVLSKVIKTFLLIMAVLIALPMVGIDLTMLSVFGGALGVGLGFGLQKIASNYVSGFIILADHSVRPGDRLNINGFTGYVTKITSRFVVLRNLTGSEALIPNDTFVSSTVINESYSSTELSNKLIIQVAYGTDLNLALKLFTQAAAKQARVCKDPAPNSFVTEFADSGINLYLLYWVRDPELGFLGLNSAILLEVWRSFTEAGIEFPYPQREIRILNNEQDPVPFNLANTHSSDADKSIQATHVNSNASQSTNI